MQEYRGVEVLEYREVEVLEYCEKVYLEFREVDYHEVEVIEYCEVEGMNLLGILYKAKGHKNYYRATICINSEHA